MPRRIAYNLAEMVASELRIGIEPLDVLDHYPEVGRATIYRISRSLRLLGTSYPPPSTHLGRRRRITPFIEEDLVDLLSTRPTLYLDEIAYHLLVEHGVAVSEATISNTLRRISFSRKVTQRVAAQRNEAKRLEYYINLASYTAKQLVFVDESAANERTLDRKYGWAPKGFPAIDIKILHRSTRWSILPAYTVDGYPENTLITQGLVNGETFANWLEESVLPQCMPFPGPRSVLVMDNCSTHKVPVR